MKLKKKVSKINIKKYLILQKDTYQIFHNLDIQCNIEKHIKDTNVYGKVLMRNSPVGTDKAIVQLPLL